MLKKMEWGNRSINFAEKTMVMGIINCTHDSFYPGSRKPHTDAAYLAAMEMISQGIDIIDIGGESTRPGSEFVSVEEEMERICPVIEVIRRESDVLISVDTRKSAVAETALDLGADIVNDISSLKSDGELKHLIARRGIPVVLMHMRGTPKTMQQNPVYEDTLEEVRRELKNSIDEALKAGIAKDRIIIDPGIGFGKRLEDNLRIINCLEELKSLNHPILIGLSRKSFLGSILDLPVEERLIGTVTANTIAIIRGANIIRVHDPREAIQMARVADAVLRVPR